jgi:hypothetical protein
VGGAEAGKSGRKEEEGERVEQRSNPPWLGLVLASGPSAGTTTWSSFVWEEMIREVRRKDGGLRWVAGSGTWG